MLGISEGREIVSNGTLKTDLESSMVQHRTGQHSGAALELLRYSARHPASSPAGLSLGLLSGKEIQFLQHAHTSFILMKTSKNMQRTFTH